MPDALTRYARRRRLSMLLPEHYGADVVAVADMLYFLRQAFAASSLDFFFDAGAPFRRHALS